MAEYVDQRKPYWLTLRHPRDREMYWDLWNYAPLAHYDRAIDELQDQLDAEVRTDGGYADLHNGQRQAQTYYWLDPDTGAALEHTAVGEEKTIPFFPDEDNAKEYLEHRAETGAEADYDDLSLYRSRTRKVADAVDVLTDQSGIEDFMPDGGTTDSELQIPNSRPEEVWFWYNPSLDSIVQEEVEPYTVKGVFESEADAQQFLSWYADQYDLDDTSHLELYRADLTLEGYGRKHCIEDTADGDEWVEQAGIDDW